MKGKQTMFQACIYKGKPAVFDTIARVYYFGYRTMEDAKKKAHDLNTGA